jgi:hypothetical protein
MGPGQLCLAYVSYHFDPRIAYSPVPEGLADATFHLIVNSDIARYDGCSQQCTPSWLAVEFFPDFRLYPQHNPKIERPFVSRSAGASALALQLNICRTNYILRFHNTRRLKYIQILGLTRLTRISPNLMAARTPSKQRIDRG